MGDTDMTIEEFEDLAFAHGADTATWPDAVRNRGADFILRSSDAETVLIRVRDLEAALALARPADPAPSVELMSRILADAAMARCDPKPATAPPPPAEAALFVRLRAFFSPAAACAASAALGLWLGYAGPVDLSDMAIEALGVETELEFALLDSVVASPIAGVLDILEVSE